MFAPALKKAGKKPKVKLYKNAAKNARLLHTFLSICDMMNSDINR